MLAALEMVDYVVVFDETRAHRIIRQVRPAVLVKGEDWSGKPVDGEDFVSSYGGRVVLAPLLAGHSTTATISRLRIGGSDGNAPRSRKSIAFATSNTRERVPGKPR
jgi:D-beta-D-heptose 7-phosphate kinase/D-beta-D-heptose 1-phosphate adenosyltransferase